MSRLKKKELSRTSLEKLTYLTTPEAAEYLRISDQTMRNLIRKGEILAYHLPDIKKLVVKREDLNDLIVTNPVFMRREYHAGSREIAKYLFMKGWSLYNSPFKKEKHDSKAKWCVQKSISLIKKDPWPHLLLAFMFKTDGNDVEAMNEFEEALRVNPELKEMVRQCTIKNLERDKKEQNNKPLSLPYRLTNWIESLFF